MPRSEAEGQVLQCVGFTEAQAVAEMRRVIDAAYADQATEMYWELLESGAVTLEG